jgi:putative ABC transport system substrate-binding protein
MLLALVLAMVMTACGSAATNTPAATTASATTAPTATTAAATTTTAAPRPTTAATSATTAAVSATTAATGGRTNLACTAPSAAIAANPGKTWLIGIAVQNTIPALEDAIRGVKEGMADCGFVEGKNVRYELGNALGDLPALATIGQKFRDLKVDLIVAVGTLALANMYNQTQGAIPIVFNSVTDPYAALKDIIKSPTDHGNITGIQALPPVADGLKIAKQILPNAKNAGLVWTSSEPNSQVTTKLTKDAAPSVGLTVIDGTITKAEEVLQTSQSIVDRIDFFFSTTDVTVVAALESMVQVSISSKKPIISLDPYSAPRGVLIAYGIDYYNGGVNSVRMVEKILSGTAANKIDIEVDKSFEIRVNAKTSELTGVKVPDDLLKRATKVYNEITPLKR